MKRKERSTGESLTRAQSFLRVYADVLGPLEHTPAGRQLDDAVTALAAHALVQDCATLAVGSDAERTRQATNSLRARYMSPIAAFARRSLQGTPDFAALTQSSRGKKGRTLVASARAMATAAAPLAAHFTQAGFPPAFIEQFERQADVLEAAVAQRLATVATRIGARSGVEIALASGREAIAKLDPIVTRRLESSELLASWRATKRVVNVPGAAVSVAPSPVSTPAAAEAKAA